MPQLANFSTEVVKDVLSRYGIHVIHDYKDGQLMWGTEPLTEPYSGEFHITDAYTLGRIGIFSIRAILSKLDKAGHQEAVLKELFDRINEGVE